MRTSLFSLTILTAAVMQGANLTSLTSGPYRFSAQGQQAYLILGELATGRSFTETERSAIISDCHKSFREEPKKIHDASAQLEAQYPRLAALKDPSERARAGAAVLSHMYFVWQATKSKPDAMRDIVLRNTPIVVTDPAAKIVVSDRATQGLVDGMDFVARLAGVPTSSAQDRAKFRKDLPSLFPKWNAQAKKNMEMAEGNYLQVQRMWAAMPQRNKNDVLARLKSQVKTSEDAGKAYGQFYAYAGWNNAFAATQAELDRMWGLIQGKGTDAFAAHVGVNQLPK